VGKTNMTEFAFSGVGINPHYGTPVNPTDSKLARIPGGSSSGAAVSVALGLSVAGLGSDTGGSIRVPAALNGLVGFKNTQNRTPLKGALELSHSLDTVCAMTRSVEDCWLVDGILAGEPLKVIRRPLSAMRFAIPQTIVLDGMAPEVATAFNRAISALSKAGAQLVDIPLTEFAELAKINLPVGFAPIESYAVHYDRLMRAEHKFDPLVARRVKLGESVTAKQYLDLINRRSDWIKRTEGVIQGFDAVLCPTSPILAPEIAALAASEEAFFKANGLLLRNTSIFNFLDGCSFSLPCQTEGELPVGLMVSSVHGDDARLVAVAWAIESCLQAA
jgi:aspartyl-tRNA(Asn)/glutamyl-tRNA(Gln) amidotransferase subunit A